MRGGAVFISEYRRKMEPLFKNSVTMNESTFRKIVEETMAISPRKRQMMFIFRCVYAFATIAVAVQGWVSFTSKNDSVFYIALGVLSVILLLFFGSRALFYKQLTVRSAVKKSLKRQKEVGAENRTDEYKFYDDHFSAVTQRYRQGKKIFYRNVTNVVESETFYFIHAKEQNSFIFNKDELVGGTKDEFKTYLEGKLPCPIKNEI